MNSKFILNYALIAIGGFVLGVAVMLLLATGKTAPQGLDSIDDYTAAVTAAITASEQLSEDGFASLRAEVIAMQAGVDAVPSVVASANEHLYRFVQDELARTEQKLGDRSIAVGSVVGSQIDKEQLLATLGAEFE